MHLRCCLLVPCVRGLLGPGGWDVVGDGRKQAVSGTSPQHTSTPSGPFKRIVWRSCSDSPTPYDSGRVCRERIMPLSAPLPYPNPAACGHSWDSVGCCHGGRRAAFDPPKHTFIQTNTTKTSTSHGSTELRGRTHTHSTDTTHTNRPTHTRLTHTHVQAMRCLRTRPDLPMNIPTGTGGVVMTAVFPGLI
jgi:hypothetical protein